MPKGSKRAARPKTLARAAPAARQTHGDRQRRERPSSVGGLRRLLPIIGPVGIVAVIAVVLVIAADSLLGGEGKPTVSAISLPDQGTQHINVGQTHPAYNSTPPTSGWHYEQPAPWGILDTPVAEETQVHNLEHGGIMVQYWCPEGCPQLVDQLKGVVGRYRSKVTLAPYAKPLPNRIALTAWTWIDTFDEFDEKRIVSFIDAHKNRGPEQVPD